MEGYKIFLNFRVSGNPVTIQLKATLQYFPECNTVRYAVQGGPGFVDGLICSNESYYEQYFSVVLFITLK